MRSGACHPFHPPNVVVISSVKPSLTCAKRCRQLARLGRLLTGVDSLLLAHGHTVRMTEYGLMSGCVHQSNMLYAGLLGVMGTDLRCVLPHRLGNL